MSASAPRTPLRVGLAGFGAVGQRVAAALDRGVPDLVLAAVTSRNLDRAGAVAGRLLKSVPPIVPLTEAVERSDVIVEAAPAAAFPEIAHTTLAQGRSLVVLSVGALLERADEYVALARAHRAGIHIASGAIGGLDAIAAAAQGRVDEVVLVTRKPPRALVGAPYLVEREIDLFHLAEPVVVFEGTAREACRGFPANVNVAAAVSLAGVGPDRTKVRIVADPSLERNTHEVSVSGEFGRFTLLIENRPTENPRTGILTALSAIATLRRLAAPLRVGT